LSEESSGTTEPKGPWIGVDLDGTLAFYDEWRGPDHIGAPIRPMVDRVKRWVADGLLVKVLTARVHPSNPGRTASTLAFFHWSLATFGFVLTMTHEKDFDMIELWDDRCVQVIPNTGQRADGKP
jgi:hypothetical protein